MKVVRVFVTVFSIILVVCSMAECAQKASNPSPADQQTEVPLRPVFRWDYVGDSCNVYAGLEKDSLRLLISRTTSSEYQSPSELPPETVFFWRVDVNSGDQVIEGDIWAFRTESILDSNGCNIGYYLSLPFILITLPLLLLTKKR